jgi:hypothetical protein
VAASGGIVLVGVISRALLIAAAVSVLVSVVTIAGMEDNDLVRGRRLVHETVDTSELRHDRRRLLRSGQLHH